MNDWVLKNRQQFISTVFLILLICLSLLHTNCSCGSGAVTTEDSEDALADETTEVELEW